MSPRFYQLVIFRSLEYSLNLLLEVHSLGRYNINSGPLTSILAYRFKSITRVKLSVFVLKVATSGPNLTFL